MTESIDSRYCIGIDLGTTNCAVSYIDTDESPVRIHTFMIPQFTAPGELEARPTLPSFHYEPAQGECADGLLQLPWDDGEKTYAIGSWAREQGALVPGRQIASAKSWLCHSGIDRTAKNLPWHGASDVTRLSPVECTTRILLHIREAWNHAFEEEPLESQSLTITVPASFDEVARELTVDAAHAAGLTHFVLLEEPQAAFYAWLQRYETDWQEQIAPGQVILVCDIGGGTTDFTLISCEDNAASGVSFRRISVGHHLLLGGDNLDLALAHYIEENLPEDQTLSVPQWSELIRRCRSAKERLLGENPPESLTLSIMGTGHSVIGGSIQQCLTKQEAKRLLLDGFFPCCHSSDTPQTQASGFREFGLPYAPDAAITKYLAAFLSEHDKSGIRMPDYMLLNGGVLESPAIRQRLLSVMSSWFDGHMPKQIENKRLDLAVAQGAAYFGLVRQGKGVRVKAGLARSYYIGIESGEGAASDVICLAPSGMQESQEIQLDQIFALRVRQPVEFPFYSSSLRTQDSAGTQLMISSDEFTVLPPIRTVLKTGKKKTAEVLSVRIRVKLTDIGVLEVWAEEVKGTRKWRLQIDVRATVQLNDTPPAPSQPTGLEEISCTQDVKGIMADIFSKNNNPALQPNRIISLLEDATHSVRAEWSLPLLRTIWETMIPFPDARQMSAAHEARWLNLLGYSLRPGFGFAVDDWRVEQTWRLFHQKVEHQRNEQCRAEWWIMWRRIAGGLTKGQQQSLASPLISILQRNRSEKTTSTKWLQARLKAGSHEISEIWRLLGSLELLDAATRQKLGEWLIGDMEAKGIQVAQGAVIWALGRIGERSPAYSSLCHVLPSKIIESWIKRLMQIPGWQKEQLFSLALMTRRTGDRYRDINPQLRAELLSWLQAQQASARTMDLIESEQLLDQDEQAKVLGDRLPTGLFLLE